MGYSIIRGDGGEGANTLLATPDLCTFILPTNGQQKLLDYKTPLSHKFTPCGILSLMYFSHILELEIMTDLLLRTFNSFDGAATPRKAMLLI